MSYFVYLLLCKDQSIYTGITTDVKRRFQEHLKKGTSHYTSSRGAKKILYTEKYSNRSQALKREAEIKTWRRERKLTLTQSK